MRRCQLNTSAAVQFRREPCKAVLLGGLLWRLDHAVRHSAKLTSKPPPCTGHAVQIVLAPNSEHGAPLLDLK